MAAVKEKADLRPLQAPSVRVSSAKKSKRPVSITSLTETLAAAQGMEPVAASTTAVPPQSPASTRFRSSSPVAQRTRASSQESHLHIASTRAESVVSNGSVEPLPVDVVNRGKPEKQGHRLVVDDQVFFKKTLSEDIMTGIQLGIRHSVGSEAGKLKWDLLMGDFQEMLEMDFPSQGGHQTPPHHLHDFHFKCYAPKAFAHFREHYGIIPADYMISLCNEPLKELSNPGASGSLFFMSPDDQFIIKTVQKRESDFLRRLLPAYYLHLTQGKNSLTFLPKFYGLFNYQTAFGSHIRFVVMNNLLPSTVDFHERYDLKGSLYNRQASARERQKPDPTYKDLDFLERHPGGFLLPRVSYNTLMEMIPKDCRVLRSFAIMDYSLLIGVHMLSPTEIAEIAQSLANASCSSVGGSLEVPTPQSPGFLTAMLSRHATDEPVSPRTQRRAQSIISDKAQKSKEPLEWKGGLLAKTARGERCLLFIGIIDILQQYRTRKKLEHTWKALIHPGQADTISVHRPEFYETRFTNFFRDHVFKLDEGDEEDEPPTRKGKGNRRSRMEKRRSTAPAINDDSLPPPSPVATHAGVSSSGILVTSTAADALVPTASSPSLSSTRPYSRFRDSSTWGRSKTLDETSTLPSTPYKRPTSVSSPTSPHGNRMSTSTSAPNTTVILRPIADAKQINGSRPTSLFAEPPSSNGSVSEMAISAPTATTFDDSPPPTPIKKVVFSQQPAPSASAAPLTTSAPTTTRVSPSQSPTASDRAAGTGPAPIETTGAAAPAATSSTTITSSTPNPTTTPASASLQRHGRTSDSDEVQSERSPSRTSLLRMFSFLRGNRRKSVADTSSARRRAGAQTITESGVILTSGQVIGIGSTLSVSHIGAATRYALGEGSLATSQESSMGGSSSAVRMDASEEFSVV